MLSRKRLARQAKFHQIDLYPVTCEALSNGRKDVEVLQACMEGGASIIQLRDKVSCKKDLYAKALAFRKITNHYQALLIINDHMDIALSVDADGVHLGQNDLPIQVARKIAPDMILGQSCHTWEDVDIATKEDADYINIGPVYSTATKNTAVKPLGLDLVKLVNESATIPFTVMGGIKRGHIPELIRAGASKIAIVTAVTQAKDIQEEVRHLRSEIRSS